MKKLFIFFLFLISCATVQSSRHFYYSQSSQRPPTITIREVPVYIDKNIGKEDQLHIDDALNAWNYALNNYIKFVIVSNEFDMATTDLKDIEKKNGLAILTVDSKTCTFIPPITYDKGLQTAAWANTAHHVVYIVRDRLKTQDIFGITLHEVGHILGAAHDSENDLMYPTYSLTGYECIDRRTIDQVAAVNHLDSASLNACYYVYP